MKREFIVVTVVLFVLTAGCGGPGEVPEETDEEDDDPSDQPPDDPVDEDGDSDDEPVVLAGSDLPVTQ